ncbi:VWFA and cache domain-containing protein 1-like [Convolutriloba macropyga]|uniref:VWFA and cache domain-containing protein 1-like n=1 Tax=Convolutriloba macropyga TaxID=536237 RepID=UPI003F51D880
MLISYFLCFLYLYSEYQAEPTSQLELKLKIFTNEALTLKQPEYNSSNWTRTDKRISLINETRQSLEKLFLSIEDTINQSKTLISSTLRNGLTNESLQHTNRDCCDDSLYATQKSQGVWINKALACQRTFPVEYIQCNSTTHLSEDVVKMWKRHDIWHKSVNEQWYVSIRSKCVSSFVYPAKKDSSMCGAEFSPVLHNFKKEAIASAIVPSKRHWAFLFDSQTISGNSTGTLFLTTAANFAFSIAQFAGPADRFTISGWPENVSSSQKFVNCGSRKNVLGFFSTHSLSDNVDKYLDANKTENYRSLAEEMESVLKVLNSSDADTEKVLVVFSGMKPSNFKSQHEQIMKLKPLMKNLNLAVFRVGNIMMYSSLLSDEFWSTSKLADWREVDALLKSKSVKVITPMWRPDLLSIAQVFPKNSTHFVNARNYNLTYSYPKNEKGEMVMTISAPVKNAENGDVDGVVGVDINLESILNELNYHTDENKTLFIVDEKGSVIYHRVTNYNRDKGFVSITLCEPPLRYYFSTVLKKDASTFFQKIIRTKKTAEIDVQLDKFYRYSCSRLANSPFVVCTMLIGDQYEYDVKLELALKNVPVGAKNGREGDSNVVSNESGLKFEPNIMYHDSVDNQERVCKYFTTLSLPYKGIIGLFVSKRALHLHYRGLELIENERFEQFFLNLHDVRHNPREPLFRNHSVVSLKYIWSLAFKWSPESIINTSFIRRYAATSDGFMIIQPAIKLDKNMDINQLNWFKQAAEGGFHQHFSSPWLDESQAGYVVSVSWKVPLTNTTFVVVGFDVTVESLYSHTLYNTQKFQNPDCQPENGKDCFLFNEEGNIVAYSRMWNSSLDSKNSVGYKWRDINMFSVAYRESDFFLYISQLDGFYSKEECYDYRQDNFRFSQKFSLDYSGKRQSYLLNNGTAFSVRRLAGTNLFHGIRGVMDETVNFQLCFCPRTHKDRCYLRRPFDNRCWCPCVYLDSADDNCRAEEPHSVDNWVACEPQPEVLKIGALDKHKFHDASNCIGFRCSSLTEQSKCDQNRECRWCEFEQVYFRSNNSRVIFPMQSHQCDQLTNCYMRVRGFSPYAKPRYYDSQNQRLAHHSGGSSTTTPIGPVAGGVLASSIVIALAVFLIRHERQRRQMIAMYNANYTSDVNVQMGAHEVDDYSLEQEEDDIGYMNPMLHPLPIIAIRNDRRHHHHTRSYATDSDHGYSTMSPHEDSEPNPGAYSDATSVDRSVIEHNSPTDEESERSSTCTGVSASTIAKAKKRIQHQQQKQLPQSSSTTASVAKPKITGTSKDHIAEGSSSSPAKNTASDSNVTDVGSGSEIEAEVHAMPANTVALAYC